MELIKVIAKQMPKSDSWNEKDVTVKMIFLDKINDDRSLLIVQMSASKVYHWGFRYPEVPLVVNEKLQDNF